MNHPHYRDRVKVGSFSILVSGAHTNVSGAPVPDLGVYLDSLWNSVRTPYPSIVVDWPDGGALRLKQIVNLIKWCVSKMEAGKLIEVACLAGHGRTGALAACLLVRLESLPTWDAIVTLRRRHCQEDVESSQQVHMIESYYNWRLANGIFWPEDANKAQMDRG
jgi:hypothetical protein